MSGGTGFRLIRYEKFPLYLPSQILGFIKVAMHNMGVSFGFWVDRCIALQSAVRAGLI